MRIRSTVTRIYDGPFPERTRDYYALTKCAANVGFIYLLFDADDRLLYVGRSRNPGTRFDKHKRHKAWWPEVASLSILEVAAADYQSSVHAVADAELAAIRALEPVFNIAGRKRRDLVQG